MIKKTSSNQETEIVKWFVFKVPKYIYAECISRPYQLDESIPNWWD